MTRKYILEDCVEMHRKHPTTFEIPGPEHLDALKVGDYVKLIFKPEDEGHPAERMWVQLTAITKTTLTGRLSNDPFFFARDVLKDMDVVRFTRKHIASVMPLPPQAHMPTTTLQ